MDDAATTTEHDDDDGHRWQRLRHRWLVEYNPLYLVSAALVLVGVVELSGGLAHDVGIVARFGVTAIAELYAWSLIGGAALLMRLGRRRPATMLALLAALYQCDLTLHTEICALSGTAGRLGAAAWLAGFALKLVALARAMRLSLSASAFAVPVVGATAITLLPWVTRALSPHDATLVVCTTLFLVMMLGAWTERAVTSHAPLRSWPALVMRRALRATWIGWAAMACLHVGVSIAQSPAGFDDAPWFALAALLAVRWIERERWVWLLAATALGTTALGHATFTPMVALLAASTLALRAHRRPSPPEHATVPWAGRDPYRTVDDDPASVRLPHRGLVVECTAVRNRLCFAALGCVALAAWTLGHGDPSAPSRIGLELLLLLFAIGTTWRTRSLLPLLWPVVSLVQLASALGLVPLPSSRVQWGVTSVLAGFALLFLSLAVAARDRARRSVA